MVNVSEFSRTGPTRYLLWFLLEIFLIVTCFVQDLFRELSDIEEGKIQCIKTTKRHGRVEVLRAIFQKILTRGGNKYMNLYIWKHSLLLSTCLISLPKRTDFIVFVETVSLIFVYTWMNFSNFVLSFSWFHWKFLRWHFLQNYLVYENIGLRSPKTKFRSMGRLVSWTFRHTGDF